VIECGAHTRRVGDHDQKLDGYKLVE